ncbi:MAG: hypothetical protein KJN63_04375, partial [Acidimicrobiia bacterium]|nr:hypothetical protein [Acidimicrobiia bacterium]
MTEALRIVVAGYIVRFPLGGMTWHYLQYVLGLAQLGHDVVMIEDSDDYPNSCYDPGADQMGPDASVGLDYAGRVFDRVGMSDRWAYFDVNTNEWSGPSGPRAKDICSSADVFVNVSGTSPVREWAQS